MEEDRIKRREGERKKEKEGEERERGVEKDEWKKGEEKEEKSGGRSPNSYSLIMIRVGHVCSHSAACVCMCTDGF